jgi:transcriptional regulator with XRE-family HTH domain
MAIQEFDQRHRTFVEWLLTPPPSRSPRTQTELAEVLGVAKQTLSTWRADSRFKEELAKAQQGLAADPSKIQHLLDALYEKAMEGDTKSADLWLRSTGALKSQVDVSVNRDFGSLSDAELTAFLSEAAVDERAKRAVPE